jgi:hypothetical protein
MGCTMITNPEVRRILDAAGWNEERNSSTETESWSSQLSPGFRLFPAAEMALTRYGGIHVKQSGPGAEAARESFELNPLLAIGEEDRFAEHALRIGEPLYPLGEAGNGHVFLAIAADGRVFALMEDLWFLGESMEAAIETLVLGRLPQTVL